MRRLPAIALAVVFATSLVPPSAQAQDQSCSFQDPSGDGGGIILGVGQSAYNEDALDIVEASASWDQAGQALEFTIEVEDLDDDGLPPTGTNGEYFDWNFTVDGLRYGAQYFHSRVDGDERWTLIQWGDGGRSTLAHSDNSPVSGTVDPATDLITIRVPAIVVLEGADDPVFTLRSSAEISNLEVISRREIVVLVPDVDEAAPTDDACGGLTVGAVDGSSGSLGVGDSEVFRGGGYTVATQDDENLTYGLADCPVDDCWRRQFSVVADTGTLVVSLENVEGPTGLDDLDLFLDGAGGRHIARGAGNDHTIAIPLGPGRVGTYEIEVLAHLAVQATFEVHVAVVEDAS